MFEHRLQHGFLVGEVVGFGDLLGFLVQAVEVGGGDLEGVELEGGTLGVESVVVERTHYLVEGKLEAHGVLNQADGVVGALGVGGFVEDAVLAGAAGGRGARRAVELGVLAAGSEVGVSSAIGHIPLPGGVSSGTNELRTVYRRKLTVTVGEELRNRVTAEVRNCRVMEESSVNVPIVSLASWRG
ncbi:MAG: hypothetical protein LAO06_16230 [Acidobacteriia bacterium]|nr:hypothetical protein [Terriglobia bacterium]